MKIEGPYAEVLVQSKEACHACAARALCSFNESGQALLRVLNPLSARPGDLVEIEVPETTYSKHFILIFGLLILFSVSGALLGTIFSPLVSLSANVFGVIGFVFGAGLASIIIWKIFRQSKRALLPIIRDILEHGGHHG
ncbi:MAG: SoxR reducing system RseC family protein [Candidatus Aminicenantes bacterium]|nr:SoxR reducing system RseC family protein [Candidatus Aminicenantes bacterium]